MHCVGACISLLGSLMYVAAEMIICAGAERPSTQKARKRVSQGAPAHMKKARKRTAKSPPKSEVMVCMVVCVDCPARWEALFEYWRQSRCGALEEQECCAGR